MQSVGDKKHGNLSHSAVQDGRVVQMTTLMIVAKVEVKPAGAARAELRSA